MGFCEWYMMPVGKICNITSNWSIIFPIKIILSKKKKKPFSKELNLYA